MHRQMETHVRGWGANQGGEAWEWAPFTDDDLARYVNLGPYMNAAALTVSEALPLSKALDCLQQVCPTPQSRTPPTRRPAIRGRWVSLPPPLRGWSVPDTLQLRLSVPDCGTYHTRLPLSQALPLPTPTAPPTAVINLPTVAPTRVPIVHSHELVTSTRDMSLTVPPDERRWLYDTSQFWTTRGASAE